MVVLILVLHVIICIVLYILIRMSVLRCSRAVMPLVCMVPFWGAAALLVLEIRTRGNRNRFSEVGIEKLKINDIVHKSILMEEDIGENRTVPLEEALIINPPSDRRELMMDIMYADPNDYVEQLKSARMNDDTEVVHYAVTALAELQKEYELSFQELEWKMSQRTEDEELIDEYLRLLNQYLACGIAEGNDRKLKMQMYSRMLGKKLKEKPEKKNLWKEKAETDLRIGAYEEARQEICHILEKWKEDEWGYLLLIRYYTVMQDRQGIEKILEQIEKEQIYLTPEGRKEIQFWKEEEHRESEK